MMLNLIYETKNPFLTITETDNDRLNAYDNDVTFDMMMDSRQY